MCIFLSGLKLFSLLGDLTSLDRVIYVENQFLLQASYLFSISRYILVNYNTRNYVD